MSALNQPQPAPSTFADRFGMVGLSGAVRVLTKTLTDAVPKHPSIASLRADVMAGKKEPVKHLLRLAYAAIDLGVPAAKVVQWAKDFIAQVEQYAARRERRQSAGVLPFEQVHVRLVTRSLREGCEAEVTTAGVDVDCPASLEQARKERLEAIEQDGQLVELYTRRIAELRAIG